MANEEQLSILKQGVHVWNRWREENPEVRIDLRGADLRKARLVGAHLIKAALQGADLTEAHLRGANLWRANLSGADLRRARLLGAHLLGTRFIGVDFRGASLSEANLRGANLEGAALIGVDLLGSKFSETKVVATIFANSDLSKVIGLEDVVHHGPSSIATNTFIRSSGKIPEVFLRGCGLSDWEIEEVKLYDPDLSNEEINNIQYKVYELRATQALQISPLFISYSHSDSVFVDKLESKLNAKGIRFWRDLHDMKSGRIEKQIDRAIRQNPTVLLVLSENSLKSDWVEHEVHTARALEKGIGHDVLCPLALDDSWKSSSWPKRVMEQIIEYNILDFSEWEDDSKFDGMFRKLIDGLELFYKK